MTRILNVAIILLAAVLVAVILLPQIREGRPRVVRFACDSTVASLPFLVAVEQVMFTDNRIIPELEFYSDPDSALAALFAGEIDVGIFPWTTVIRRITEHGETLRVFMSGEFRATLPVDAIAVPVDSRIKDLPGLRRHKLGYPPQLRDCIRPFLVQTGLPADLVTTVELPLSELVPKLTAGEIHAAWLLEPFVCGLDTTEFRLLKTGVLPEHVSAPFPGAAVGFSSDYLRSGRLLLSRLKIALDAAAAWSDTRADSARLIIAQRLLGSDELVGNCRLPDLQRLVEINKTSVRGLAMRLDITGVIEEDFDTDSIFVAPAQMVR